ncbi:hemerythrin domain-containing protein [Rhodococcus sp. X156]|uniref:hemerythrin domain-containing protein n=1 Tax=Rhodococcus sp. X156 TaxID=2499145 RepID=UPI000FDCC563|nr:hemerythrin domain-containing protein [Rhodococcus sp. X156]
MTTSIAHQSIEELGGPTSILARQRSDHERLDHLMTRARETEAAGGLEHEQVLRAVARLVFTHAFAEESVLFPAARKALPEGDPLTLEIEEEHQEVNEVMTELDRSEPGDPGRHALMERAFTVLDQDVRDEEDRLLPRLQELMTPQQLRAQGWQWWALRRTSPTRPHPMVSRRPPGQVLSALPLTVLDRSRDALQVLNERTDRRMNHLIGPADQALATAAGAVERLPIMRKGDKAPTSR